MQSDLCISGGRGFSLDVQAGPRGAFKPWVSPQVSRKRNRFLFTGVSLMRRITFGCEAGFGITDFSLSAFPLAQEPKPHRLMIRQRSPQSLCHSAAADLRSVFLREVRTNSWPIMTGCGPARGIGPARIGCGLYAWSRLGGLASRSLRCFGGPVARRRLAARQK